VSLGFGDLRWRIHSTNLLAGVLFVAVGVFVIANTFAGGLETSQTQTQLSEYLRSAAQVIVDATRGGPDVVFSVVLAGLVLYLIARAFGWRLDRMLRFLHR